MGELHIPRNDKLSLPSRMRTLAVLIALSWGALYAGYRLIRWVWYG